MKKETFAQRVSGEAWETGQRFGSEAPRVWREAFNLGAHYGRRVGKREARARAKKGKGR